MRAKLVLAAFGLFAALHAQPPSDLLQRVTRKVLDTVNRLPRYMCTQTIDRQRYVPASGRPASPCEPAARRHMTLATSDRLRLDVAVAASRELYSWVGESRFDDRSLFDLVGQGALSTGAFSTILTLVFRDDNSAFSYQGVVQKTAAGRPARALDRFDFHVPVATSHYLFRGATSRVMTGYYGSILVDPVTADLVRLEVHTEGLPPETGSCQCDSILDYARMRLNDADFLLPSRVELHILDSDGAESRNTTVYSGCREFLGESTLHFDSASESAPAAGPTGRPGFAELPPGLSFTIELIHPIDPASAAAGDRVLARLTEPIRDAQHHILVPARAPVTARILQIRQFYRPVSLLRATLKLETIEVAGAPRPLTAEPDTSAPPVAPPRGSLRTRFNSEMADDQDRFAAIFTVTSIRSTVTMPTGFQSRWFTARREP